MPTIVKQNNAKPVTKRGGTVFDRIAPVNDIDSGGLKVSLYGRSKTGKTRLISTFPKPVLIIGAEDGTRSIRGVKGVDFVLIRSSEEAGELITGATSRKYATIAIDTASRLSDLILAEILGITELPAQKSWGMASRDQYGQSSLKLKTLLRIALDLPINVVITAHERNFNEDNPSDLLLPSIGSALSPSVTGWLNGAVEYICQTFIREKYVEKLMKVGTKETKVRQKAGGVEYCLRVGPDAVYQTGFRLPPGVVLPDSIVDPTFDKINKLVKGVA